jgi:Glycosyl transferase family 2
VTSVSDPITIAVVIPNRNDSRFLRDALESVLAQSPPADEIIFVDDQSTDDSVAIAREYLARHPNARVIENPKNLGTNGAMNVGLGVAQSRFIFFFASNDVMRAGLLARAKQSFEAHPEVGMWCARMTVLDEAGRPLGTYPTPVVALRDTYLSPARCRKLVYRTGSWFAGSMVYRRDALAAIGGFDAELKGLSDLVVCWILVARHGAAYSPVPLANMRLHTGSLLGRTLSDGTSLELAIARISTTGPHLAPELFTASMLDRIARRWRFAAARSAPQNIPEIAPRLGALRGRLVALVDRLPPSWTKLRTALLLLVIRAHDILPMLWYRVFGGWLLRLFSR